MDDISFVGPTAEVFRAFSIFRMLAAERSVQVNLRKTHVQQPRGPASELTLALAAQAGLAITYGNHPYLGAVVGVDDAQASSWLLGELTKPSPLSRAVRDRNFPCALAYQITKVNLNPSVVYHMRSFPMRVASAPVAAFHLTLVDALCNRLQLPSPLQPSASLSLTQPGANGGLGLRDLTLVIPAAKWASAASVAADIATLISSPPGAAHLPCVADREEAHRAIVIAAKALGCEEETLETEYHKYLDYVKTLQKMQRSMTTGADVLRELEDPPIIRSTRLHMSCSPSLSDPSRWLGCILRRRGKRLFGLQESPHSPA
jgi:hypothetical protein